MTQNSTPQKPTRPALMWLGLSLLLLLLGAVSSLAQGDNQAALMVVYEDGTRHTQCISFSEPDLDGYEFLLASGLPLNINADYGLGVAVCSINNEGCRYPQQDCFCESYVEPYNFWVYWHWDNGAWQQSDLGASNRTVRNGDLEAWVWAADGVEPPAVSFSEICSVSVPVNPGSPTATPSPSATRTPTATPTTPLATATRTPSPTATFTPSPTRTGTPQSGPTPIISTFTADRSSILRGESVTLRWNLSEAAAAYLQYDGQEQGVVAPGDVTLSPNRTTMYTLLARHREGGEAIATLTVVVLDATATPRPTNTPIPTATPIPTLTPTITPTPFANQNEPSPIAQAATPTPTASLTPTPPPTPTTTNTPRPTFTPTPTPTQTLIPTPTLVPTAVPAQAVAQAVTPAATATPPPAESSSLLRWGALGGLLALVFGLPVIIIGAGVVIWLIWRNRNPLS